MERQGHHAPERVQASLRLRHPFTAWLPDSRPCRFPGSNIRQTKDLRHAVRKHLGDVAEASTSPIADQLSIQSDAEDAFNWRDGVLLRIPHATPSARE